jgi:hypothetical protein
MIITQYWIILISWLALFAFSIMFFIRRIGRRLTRVPRRLGRRVGRTFRRVPRKINRTFRRVTRYQKKFAKTDPRVFNSIQNATSKTMKEFLDKNEWVKENKLKEQVKNKVAIEIEKDIQQSPMKNMRPLIDNTIDESINHAFLKEVKARGDQLKVYDTSLGAKFFWRVVFPLTTAGFMGLLSYNYPDKIPPGSLIIPERQVPPTGGNPPPIDPTQIVQSIFINTVVYGFGALILVGLLMWMRRK